MVVTIVSSIRRLGVTRIQIRLPLGLPIAKQVIAKETIIISIANSVNSSVQAINRLTPSKVVIGSRKEITFSVR